MSGCLGCLALLLAGGTVGIVQITQFMQHRRVRPERQRLHGLLVEFCTGADQSLTKVNQIQALQVTIFAHDSECEELITAAASFVPGGPPPFRDEVWLADRFRLFLRKSGIFVPEYGAEQAGVWPPPPNLRP